MTSSRRAARRAVRPRPAQHRAHRLRTHLSRRRRRRRRPVHARRVVPDVVARPRRPGPRHAAGFLRRRPLLPAPRRRRAAPARCARDGRCPSLGVVGPASARAHAPRPEGRPARADARHASADEPDLRGLDRSGRDCRRSSMPSPRATRCSAGASMGRSPRRSCCSGGWRIRTMSPRLPPPCMPPSSTSPTATIATRPRWRMQRSGGRRIPTPPMTRAFERCLVYLTAADDPGITILPTHRLVRPGPGIAFSLDDLWARLDDAYETEPAADGRAALAAAAVDARDAPRLCGGRARRGGGPPATATIPTAPRAIASTSRSSKPRCSGRPACLGT